MQFRPKLNWTLVKVWVFISASILAGCKDNAAPESFQHSSTDLSVSTSKNLHPTQETKAIVEGVAMKGAIANGIVTAFLVEEHAGYFQASETPIGASVRTNADGSYKLALPQVPEKGLVIRVTADHRTSMSCDVTSGCKSSTGKTVPFRSPIGLTQDFALHTAIPATGDQLVAHVTPLTHLAYAWAEQQPVGLSVTNIKEGRVRISRLLGLPSNALDARPVDLTARTWNPDVRSYQVQSAIVSASFLALANGPQWQSLSEVLDTAAKRFATSGTLTAVNLGALPDVAHSDILYAASDIAKDLTQRLAVDSDMPTSARPAWKNGSTTQLKAGTSTSLFSAERSDWITKILFQLYTKFSRDAEHLLESPVLAPVQISFNPSSVQLSKHETVTLNVNATGAAPIQYQWRKNGAVIPGANYEHLTVTAYSSQDQGEYDCVVSNAAGSVTSMPAMITVLPENLTLRWTMPSSRTDGTTIAPSELKGYRLLYGTHPEQLNRVVQIEDPYRTEYSFSQLPSPATYYFAITAIDGEGNESQRSTIVHTEL